MTDIVYTPPRSNYNNIQDDLTVPPVTGPELQTRDQGISAATNQANLALTSASAAQSAVDGLATVASSGSYNDLANQPAINDLWVPSDNNLLWATYPPMNAGTVTSQSTTVAGQLTLTRVQLRKAATLSTVWYGLAGLATGGPPTNSYLGLYDSSGTLRAVTADQSSRLVSGPAAPVGAAFTIPYAALAGEYFIALLLNGTWTTNTLTFKSSGGGSTTNSGLAAPHLNYSNMLTAQTTLPSTITLASQSTSLITGGWGSYWLGLS